MLGPISSPPVAVEAVSTLFALYSGNAAGYAEAGELGCGCHRMVDHRGEVRVAVASRPCAPVGDRRAHFGARRKAFSGRWAG